MEHRSIPCDTAIYDRLVEGWGPLKTALIAHVSREFPIFEGTTFKLDRFEELLAQREVAWPKADTGRLALDEDTFREQVSAYPWLAPIREVRDNLSKLRLSSLTVGPDGRNRTLLGVFGSKIGRN